MGTMIGQLAGGIGLFLLGMVLLTDGLKQIAGSALRRILSRWVAGPLSGVAWGFVVTALVQSSSATTLTTIGFVSAGLLTFPQAIGVIMGANIGTTSTGWIVSILGFKVSIGELALPLILVGAMLRLLGRARNAALGTALSGFGLLFVGLGVLQSGMAGLAERFSPSDFPQATVLGRMVLVGVGILMTVIMQSSSAAVATTLTALHADTIDLSQAAALVIGQNIGTTATSAIAALGASTTARRTAVAHIVFNLLTGVVALLIFRLMVYEAGLLERLLDQGNRAVALATFHTTFNLLGVALLLPVAGWFARLVEWLVPERRPALARHLDRTVEDVPAVAIEAARRTMLEIASGAAGSAAALLSDGRSSSEAGAKAESLAALRAVSAFLGRLGPTLSGDDERQRQLAVLHAVDHLSRLIETLAGSRWEGQAAVAPAVERPIAELHRALAVFQAWASGADDRNPVAELEACSRTIAEERRGQRARILQETSSGVIGPDEALNRIDELLWLDRVGYHLWRAAYHLQAVPAAGVSTDPSDVADLRQNVVTAAP